MEVDYVVVADGVIAANGKHYIHGGGWDVLWAASFPVMHPMFGVAVRLRVGWHDTNQNHFVSLNILDADDKPILPAPAGGNITAGRPPQLPVGDDQVFCLALNIQGVTFPKEGTYAFAVSIDGTEQNRQPFHVRQLSQMPGFPQQVPPIQPG